MQVCVNINFSTNPCAFGSRFKQGVDPIYTYIYINICTFFRSLVSKNKNSGVLWKKSLKICCWQVQMGYWAFLLLSPFPKKVRLNIISTIWMSINRAIPSLGAT